MSRQKTENYERIIEKTKAYNYYINTALQNNKQDATKHVSANRI